MVVDCSQGVEAQTVANCFSAIDSGLEVVPVLNKIDLPSAEPARVAREIEEIIGLEAQDALQVSAKTGAGLEGLLAGIVERIPAPAGDPDAPLKALIIDSWFDNYLGVVSLVRVVDGKLEAGRKIKIFSTGQAHLVDEVGELRKAPLVEVDQRRGELLTRIQNKLGVTEAY